MSNVKTIPIEIGGPVAQIARVASDAVCVLMSQIVKGVLGTGTKDQHALACVAVGGVIGTLQMMASIIGKAEDDDAISAASITDDTVLFAALVAASSFTVTPTGDPNAVSVDFKHEPRTYRKAAEMFQKITGRSPDGLLHTELDVYSKMTDTDILLAECGNQTKN